MSSDHWQPSRLQSDYWKRRRPYVVQNDKVWIGEPGAHHDSAPAGMNDPDSSCGEIYDDQVRPYDASGAQRVSLVEEVWRNHAARLKS